MKKSISQQLAEKTFIELGINPKTGKPPLRSSYQSLNKSNLGENRSTPPFRIKALEKTKRQSPKGLAYQYSALYRNAVVLRLLVKKLTNSLDPKKYQRLIDQLDSSARSVVANIREGYVRPSSAEYSIFLGYSHGSLEEIRGDIIDAKDDGLISSRPGSTLTSLNISLKPSPNLSPKVHLEELKRKIGEVKSSDLTYEIFIELINKTDWLFKEGGTGFG